LSRLGVDDPVTRFFKTALPLPAPSLIFSKVFFHP
jgi:hypothetical protein